MGDRARNFIDLKIWQKGLEIVTIVYESTQKFPKLETYGLVLQMRRAAISIPSNISEGFNRFHNKEYRQFLYIALGSCAELETQVEIALRLGFITIENRQSLIQEITSES